MDGKQSIRQTLEESVQGPHKKKALSCSESRNSPGCWGHKPGRRPCPKERRPEGPLWKHSALCAFILLPEHDQCWFCACSQAGPAHLHGRLLSPPRRPELGARAQVSSCPLRCLHSRLGGSPIWPPGFSYQLNIAISQMCISSPDLSPDSRHRGPRPHTRRA